jgi:hypothetical protein
MNNLTIGIVTHKPARLNATKLLGQVVQQLERVDRFFEPPVNAGRALGEVELLRRAACHREDSKSRVSGVLTNVADGRGAVAVGQSHVEEDNVGALLRA